MARNPGFGRPTISGSDARLYRSTSDARGTRCGHRRQHGPEVVGFMPGGRCAGVHPCPVNYGRKEAMMGTQRWPGWMRIAPLVAGVPLSGSAPNRVTGKHGINADRSPGGVIGNRPPDSGERWWPAGLTDAPAATAWIGQPANVGQPANMSQHSIMERTRYDGHRMVAKPRGGPQDAKEPPSGPAQQQLCGQVRK